MFKSILKVLFAVNVSLLIAGNNFGQSEEAKDPQFSVINLTGKGKPIVFAKETDGLPNSIKAKGRIIDANVSGTYCGVTATSGTLKIKLSEQIENYSNEYLYVVVLCLAGKENDDLVGKDIEIEVKKLTKHPFNFGVLTSNSIDSNGIPFYLSKVDGVGGLLKNLTNKSSNK